MRNIKTGAMAALIAAAVLLSGCGGDAGNSNPTSEPVKELGIRDVLPEIPVTDASAFTYKYDSELGGIIVSDYLLESPEVRIPDEFDGEPVVSVNLSDCKKQITELIMPDTVKTFTLSGAIIADLQYINIPDSVTKIGGSLLTKNSFYYCENLISAVYKGKTYDYEHRFWLEDAVKLGESGMLIENGKLKDVSREFTEVTIPDSVTRIDAEAFSGCRGLTSVTIPDSVTEIGYNAFEDCTSLTSVTIPNSVTEINDGAFRGCTSLTSVIIPDSVTEIWDFAFSGCKSLTNVTYKGKTYDYEHIDDLYAAINGE